MKKERVPKLTLQSTNSEKARLDNAIMSIEKYMRGQAIADTDTKYSVELDREGKPYIIIDKDILEGVPRRRWESVVKDALKSRNIDMGNFVVGINAKTRSEYLNSKYTQRLKKSSSDIYSDKLRMANNIDEVVQNSYNGRNEDAVHNNFPSFNRGFINVEIGGKDYSIEVVTGIYLSNNEVLYDIVNIEPTQINRRSPSYRTTQSAPKTTDGTPSENSLPKYINDVNGKNDKKCQKS